VLRHESVADVRNECGRVISQLQDDRTRGAHLTRSGNLSKLPLGCGGID